MSQLLGVLRALAVIAGLWCSLAIVGLVAGVVPLGAEGAAEAEAEAEAEPAPQPTPTKTTEAGARTPAPPEPIPTAPTDSTPAAVTAAPSISVAHYTVCDGAATRVTLTAAQVVADPRPELLIGCGTSFTVAALSRSANALVPAHVARFELDAPSTGVVSAGRPGAGDVDGDGLDDLLLPFLASTSEGVPTGGSLFLVRRGESGAFEDPRSLGSFAAYAAAVHGTGATTTLLALNRTNPFARRPSEAWVFRGGPSPVRTATLRTGLGAVALAVVDMNRDGQDDLALLAHDEPRLDVFFGDAQGAFARPKTLVVNGGTELVTGDVDGDGAADLLVRATGVQLVAATEGDAFEPRPIDAPNGLRELALIDIDGDGKRDIVGVDGARLVALVHREGLAFEERALATFSGTPFRPGPAVVADLDGDGGPDAAFLGRGADGAPWELVVVEGVRTLRPLTLEAAALALPDAPLTLRVPLR